MCIKNFSLGSLQPSQGWLDWTAKFSRSPFDIVLDTSKIKTDWNYVKEFTNKFDIDLSESTYRLWQNLLIYQDLPEQKTVERWTTIITDNTVIDYQKILD
jgi:hypothetical protein